MPPLGRGCPHPVSLGVPVPRSTLIETKQSCPLRPPPTVSIAPHEYGLGAWGFYFFVTAVPLKSDPATGGAVSSRRMYLRLGYLLARILSASIVGVGACNPVPLGSTRDPAERWALVEKSNACNAEVQRRKWMSITTIFSYQLQDNPKDIYAACMRGEPADERGKALPVS